LRRKSEGPFQDNHGKEKHIWTNGESKYQHGEVLDRREDISLPQDRFFLETRHIERKTSNIQGGLLARRDLDFLEEKKQVPKVGLTS
jgi:hypothetical protein